MNVRRWVLFDSDLPYDAIEGETNFIQWPGKNVAEAIMEILVRLGCTRVDMVTLDEAGYEVGFRAGKRPYGARVTVIDNYTVGFIKYAWLDDLFGRFRPEYLNVLEQVNAELNGDDRFHNVRWFKDDELFTGIEGAKSPIEE